jgi:hypothetical protein
MVFSAQKDPKNPKLVTKFHLYHPYAFLLHENFLMLLLLYTTPCPI